MGRFRCPCGVSFGRKYDLRRHQVLDCATVQCPQPPTTDNNTINASFAAGQAHLPTGHGGGPAAAGLGPAMMLVTPSSLPPPVTTVPPPSAATLTALWECLTTTTSTPSTSTSTTPTATYPPQVEMKATEWIRLIELVRCSRATGTECSGRLAVERKSQREESVVTVIAKCTVCQKRVVFDNHQEAERQSCEGDPPPRSSREDDPDNNNQCT